MPVNVRAAVSGLNAFVQAGKKQLTSATRVALNRTADKAVKAEQHEMRDVFRSPTPYTLSSVRMKPATSASLAATVELKDDATKATPATRFLAPQMQGGPRGQKRFERALQSVGAMPVGYRAVPGQAARLDAYGNMSRGQIVQILAYFRAFPEAGYKANMTDQGRAKLARGTKRRQGFTYFVGRPGDRLPLGIYQRFSFGAGGAVKPVLLFVRSAVYQERFDFGYVVETTVKKEFPAEFKQAMVDVKGWGR
jgi:hypothetical protein